MTVIRSKAFQPAREIVGRHLREVMRGDIKLRRGAGGSTFLANKELCIMEATAYILGYDDISDAPPCTSANIRDFMIDLNDADEMTDRKRAMMKRVIPDIINTAPTRASRFGPYLMTHDANPAYRRAEKQRAKMLKEFALAHSAWDDDYNFPTVDVILRATSMTKILDFVRELANVAKFDARGGER